MHILPWLPALIRALVTIVFVLSATALAESLGPFWGALVTSLPISTGPAYVFLAIQHGGDFIADSALAGCAANTATGLFLIVYGRLTRRAGLAPSLGAALLAWVAASFAVRQVAWTPITALLVNLVVYGAGFALLGVRGAADAPPPALRRPLRRRWLELLLRAALVAGFVSALVAVSAALGPQGTGIVAGFPISFSSVFILLWRRIGGAASALLAANALRSMLGFGAMLLALHLSVRPFGTVAALLIALAVSAGWSGALLVHRARRTGTRRAPV